MTAFSLKQAKAIHLLPLRCEGVISLSHFYLMFYPLGHVDVVSCLQLLLCLPNSLFLKKKKKLSAFYLKGHLLDISQTYPHSPMQTAVHTRPI